MSELLERKNKSPKHNKVEIDCISSPLSNIDVCLSLICGYLNYYELINLQLVSKQWKQAIERIHEIHFDVQYQQNQAKLLNIRLKLNRFPCLTKENYYHIPDLGAFLMTLSSNPDIKSIQQVYSLHFEDINYIREYIDDVKFSTFYARELSLCRCVETDFSHLPLYFDTNTNLNSLSLKYLFFIQENQVTSILEKCPGLFDLLLEAFLDFRQLTLPLKRLRSLIVRKCPLLTSIHLTQGPLILLTHLDLSFTKLDCSAMESLLSQCPFIQDVYLRQCLGLKGQLTIQSETLERLSLQQSTELISLEIRCPKLLQINLMNCLQLQSLVLISTQLLGLTLDMLNKLESLTLECSNLRILSLSGCERLGKCLEEGYHSLQLQSKSSRPNLRQVNSNANNQQNNSHQNNNKNYLPKPPDRLIVLMEAIIESCPKIKWKHCFKRFFGGCPLHDHEEYFLKMISRLEKE